MRILVLHLRQVPKDELSKKNITVKRMCGVASKYGISRRVHGKKER